MKKYGLLVISIFVVTILTFVGLLLLALPHFNLWLILFFVLLIIGFIFSIPFAIIVHEAGHGVFGLLNGYELVSFKFAFWEISKNKAGKYKLHKTETQAGILGQCLMAPPKYTKKMALKLKRFYRYNAGGLIFSYGLILFFSLLYLIPCDPLRWFLIPNITVNVFLALNNSIYLPYGVNDVCNAMIIKKNNLYVDSINYQLEVVSNLYQDKRLGTKTKYEPYYEDKLNHISLACVQFRFYYYVDHKEYAKALELSNVINKNYYEIKFPMQKLAVTFDILWSDLVLNYNMVLFKYHFRRLTPLELRFIKPDTDLECFYKLYEKIYQGNYDVSKEIKELLECETGFKGEALSLKDRLELLSDKLLTLKKEED